MRLVVLSTYDVMPVTSGGQTRYVNIYKQLSSHHDVTIVAYDYRQTERTKQYNLNPRLSVIVPTVLLDDAALFWDTLGRTNRVTHDVQCIRGYRFSQEFHEVLRKAISTADVVISSHPFLALVAFGYATDSTVRIYEAHNVEFDARAAYYRGTSDAALTGLLLDDVRHGEALAAGEADYVTAVSSSDADRFVELYGISRSKITIVPNGVDTASYPLLDRAKKQITRKQLALGDKTFAVFVGSAYMPNVEAYLRIRTMLAEAGYSGVVALIGTMKDAAPADRAPAPFEERWLGFVEEELKGLLLSSADFALQLMFSGAGTNLKLFDYMAARTLIVANSFGTRGVPGNDWFWPAETAEDLRVFLETKPWETKEGEHIAARARAIAEQQFDWGVIAQDFERLLSRGSGAFDALLCSPDSVAADIGRSGRHATAPASSKCSEKETPGLAGPERATAHPVSIQLAPIHRLVRRNLLAFDYELMLENTYSGFLRDGDLVADVGAHIGRHTFKFAELVGSKGCVAAFEPLPDKFEFLAKKRDELHLTNVRLYNLALSDFEGRSSFVHAVGTPEESGLKQRIFNVPERARPVAIDVEVSTLDKTLNDAIRLDYMKIDIEGGELDCLVGGKSLIQRFRPVISVEFGITSYSVYGKTPNDLLNLVNEINYEILDIFCIEYKTDEDFSQNINGFFWDFFLIPKEKREWFITSTL